VRAVLDVNVLVSAVLRADGPPGLVFRRWLLGQFELVVSDLLLRELERALAAPKLGDRIRPAERTDLLDRIRESGTLARDLQGKTAVRAPDPDDQYLLELADSKGAALVSGDRHLLMLAGRIPVYSPREFLDLLEAHG
jgi:uncharacterized protein